jgi:hypothetical protein
LGPRLSPIKIVLSWMGVTLVAFPLAGYLGWGIAGHVDSVGPALIGGALTGAGVGLAQWVFLRTDLAVGPVWILATSVALAAGLSIGAAVVGYDTTAGELAIMGSISGAAVGLAQGMLLRRRFSLWFAWIVAMPALFALRWFVTETAGIDVGKQFTVFGASGCIAFGLLSGLILMAGNAPTIATRGEPLSLVLTRRTTWSTSPWLPRRSPVFSSSFCQSAITRPT